MLHPIFVKIYAFAVPKNNWRTYADKSLKQTTGVLLKQYGAFLEISLKPVLGNENTG